MQQKSLFILITAFVLPLLIGTAYFQYVNKYGGQATSNYGNLISPMQKIQTLPKAIQGYWTYALVSLNNCDNICQNLLKQAENARILANEKMPRIRTLFIGLKPLTEKDKPKNFNSNISELKNKQHYQTLITKIKQVTNNSEIEINKNIYLIDPQGNLMMMYPPNKQNPQRMLSDMKRLLKYSRIG